MLAVLLGTIMFAKINAKRYPSFRPMLSAGLMYSLSEFDVALCAQKFMLTDSFLVILFNESTCLEELTNPIYSFPEEAFHFCDAAGLLRLTDTNRRLPDIIAEITGVRSTVKEPLKGKNHVMATVKMDSGETVILSLFDPEAISFHRKLESMIVPPMVVVATNVNPPENWRLFVNATPGTHVYFDGITSAGQDRLTRLAARKTGLPSTEPLLREIPEVEQLTIAQANSFAILHPSEEFEILCIGRVTRINSEKGWSYVACSKCSRELQRNNCGFTCVRCENTNAAGVLRYRVELLVADMTAEGVFVCFDGVMTKMHKLEAHEAGQLLVYSGVNPEDSPMPLVITCMKGKIYAFHVSLSTKKFTENRQAFTITRILGEHERLPSLDPGANGKGTSDATTIIAVYTAILPQPESGWSSVDRGFISELEFIGDVPINTAETASEVAKGKPMSLD
ncbi:unnamed protein product [Eruca vesicaria subsp. sativa]|uniref:Replication factor A C-terminal domain-containing protein n=1 Tax=Eruca vesicaria subsp. sativa TaxID=29727 RepID=A0ABC8L637_ERUVS|nr:unnamed protein product [Eruca vesicaria subsp. sativa]